MQMVPLLKRYHWADQFSELANHGELDDRYKQSLELSWEEVKHAMTVFHIIIIIISGGVGG
jgi:hypothetical protein